MLGLTQSLLGDSCAYAMLTFLTDSFSSSITVGVANPAYLSNKASLKRYTTLEDKRRS
jgi:hypothetical protein